MSEIIQTMPAMAMRGITVFPNMSLHFEVEREMSLRALEQAVEQGERIFLVTQKDISLEQIEERDLYTMGTIAVVKQVLRLPGDNVRVMVEAVSRGRMHSLPQTSPYLMAEVEEIRPEEPVKRSARTEALIRQTYELFERYIELAPKMTPDILLSVLASEDPGYIADYIAQNLAMRTGDKQAVLEELRPVRRLELLCRTLRREVEILELEQDMQGKVRDQLTRSQRDYFLREQMKAIQTELGDEDSAKEIDALRAKADKVQLSEQAREKVHKEIDRLARLSQNSPEAAVSQTYIETILELPWGVRTEDNFDLDNAQRTLDDEHFGLDKVKERIMEYLAVCQKKKDIKGPILCFVGPPGTGKTSISRSIAHAMGRKFCRMSLGGVRDEAEIRGHRRTYIGAIPGAILNHIKQAGTENPVFLLDEIDKMSSDFRGDPASAMLEVLDPEQNKTFRDHYLELDFDLSHVLFITTANSTDTIPRPLLDRMEVIEVSSYLEQEKLQIAKRYLVPKQAKENGIA